VVAHRENENEERSEDYHCLVASLLIWSLSVQLSFLHLTLFTTNNNRYRRQRKETLKEEQRQAGQQQETAIAQKQQQGQ